MRIPPRRRRAVTTLLLAAGLAPAAAAQEGPELFGEGLDRYRAGDYTGAQRLLREYVEAYGERRGAEAEHLGEAYHYLGLMTPDARLAEGYFLAVAQRYPAAPIADESLARLAQLYAVRGDHQEAREQWQALARSYPLSRYVPEVDLRVGESWFAQGELDEAYDAFSRGFSRMKEYQRSGGQGANLRELEGEYVYWIGRTLLERGAEDDARKYLNLVLLDYPGHPLEPMALYYLSATYRGQGKTREADDAWRRFGETVRNTSLESVSENPNLVAVARARESGDLERPAASETRAQDAAPAEESRAEDPPAAADAGDRRAEPRDVAAELPPEERGLRAPEPGRAGGVVAAEPLGRRVEDPAPADAPEVERPVETEPSEPTDAEREAVRAAEAANETEDRAAVEAAAAAAAEARQAAAEPAAEPAPPRRELPEAEAPVPLEETPAAVDEPPAPREAPVLEQGRAAAAGQARPPADAPALELEPIPPGVVFLQVGAFTSARSASRLSTELRGKGFEPSLASGLVNGQGYYRVRFGPYTVPAERAILESMRNALARQGFEAVVMRDERGE